LPIIKLVSGYPDTAAIFLAMERGEVSGRTVTYSTLRTFRAQWLMPGGGMRVLLQFGRTTRHPDLADVPTVRELASTEGARSLIELTELPYFMAYPFVAPPELPRDRAQALEAAIMATHKDPQFLSEAAKLRLDISPVGRAEILRTIERIAATSAATRDHLQRLLTGGRGGG
jgi:tripartite-type tricarboxylate transporter receptor subunit TctC